MSGPFFRGLEHAAELAYEAAGLKPTHGGLLPRGLGYAAPTYFFPQPIGFADPAAYGLHHDFLFGITYDRVALQFLAPEELDRRLAAARETPHAPVRPRQIRSRADVGAFDVPFLIGSGQLDYLSPEGPRPQGQPAEFSDLLQQAARSLVTSGMIEFSLPSPLPTASGAVGELRAAHQSNLLDLIAAGRALDEEEIRINPFLRVGGGSPLPLETLPVNNLQADAARDAQPPMRDVLAARTDP